MRDIRDNYLRYNPKLEAMVESLMTVTDVDDEYEAVGNLYYAAALCRVHYRRVREALPNEDDAEGMARYWKKYYNTVAGAGTVEKAVPWFEEACRGE
jgi:hypothetical protein